MSKEDTPRSNWIKPALIGVVVAALAIGGYMAVNQAPMAPQVTFIDLKGQKFSTESLRGKVVMVNFWATSCVSCVKEMPEMIQTYNKFKGQGLEFVAVAMKYDPANYVINFTDTRKLPFIVALDSGGDIAKAFDDVTMTPTTFVIGRDGRVLKKYVGIPDFKAVHALLDEALAAG